MAAPDFPGEWLGRAELNKALIISKYEFRYVLNRLSRTRYIRVADPNWLPVSPVICDISVASKRPRKNEHECGNGHSEALNFSMR